MRELIVWMMSMSPAPYKALLGIAKLVPGVRPISQSEARSTVDERQGLPLSDLLPRALATLVRVRNDSHRAEKDIKRTA